MESSIEQYADEVQYSVAVDLILVSPKGLPHPTQEKKVKAKGLKPFLEVKERRLGVGQGAKFRGALKRPEIYQGGACTPASFAYELFWEPYHPGG